MSDYSWIKAGVKAVIVWSDNYPNAIGEVVTIGSSVYIEKTSDGIRLGVDIVEGEEIAIESGDYDGIFFPEPNQLKPYRDDEKPTWESIADIIGVDIRRVDELAKV